jgi:hypothetical protein
MIAVTLVAVLSASAFMIGRVVKARQALTAQWHGAIRHTVAAIVGWFAFVVLFGLLQLLDFLERDSFSWHALLSIIQISILLLAGGAFVVTSVLLYCKRSPKPK